MHGDGDVGEDRRRANGGDRDAVPPVAVRERVADREERVVHLLVHDLEVGDRRLVERAPVHDAVRAVDPAALPEPDEERHDRADVVVVHREALARVVERAAEPPELAHDRAARLLEPLPRPLDECLATDVVARRALRARAPSRRRSASRCPRGRSPAARACRSRACGASGSSTSWSEPFSAWPMCSSPVTFGGGTQITNVSLAARAGAGRVETLGLPRLLPARLDVAGCVPRIHRARV